MKSLGLKCLGLKGLGWKLGVEKSGVEMSFNRRALPVFLRKMIMKNGYKLLSDITEKSEFNFGRSLPVSNCKRLIRAEIQKRRNLGSNL